MILITITIIFNGQKGLMDRKGERTEGNFQAASIFGKTQALPQDKKRIETIILPCYSLGTRVSPSPYTNIVELSFTTLKISPL